MISSLCQQETSAMQIMAGSVYPVLLMSGEYRPLVITIVIKPSPRLRKAWVRPMNNRRLMIMIMPCVGIIWPLEGMPKFLRYISYALPTTYAAEAMRSIMGRGECRYIDHMTMIM